MTVSAVTIGSTTGAVVGLGTNSLADPHAGVASVAGALAFTGAPHLVLEGFVGALLVMAGTLITGLARRHRARPALVPVGVDDAVPLAEDDLHT
jgi:hypothetical protein